MFNQIDFHQLKPASYNRKSSEDEDRQMLSVDSQIDEAKRISDFYKLPAFVEVFKESKSAKEPYQRKEFSRMMEMIRSGKADSIVCWKLDRLARNMTEGGEIIDLISSGAIKAIITHDKVFYPWDNVIVMSVEFSQSKQYVKDLSANVKRGQGKKARMGSPHGVAYLGFSNDKSEERGNRKWVVDDTRLPLVRDLLLEFLKGTRSVASLSRYARETLKLTTPIRKRSGGKLVAQSYMYVILRNPVYAGFFFQNDESGKVMRFELDRNMPRLITEDQYWQIQKILGQKGRPQPKKRDGLYNYLMKDENGGPVTPDFKFQLICDCKHKFSYENTDKCPKCGALIENLKKPKYLSYVFYYKTRDKKPGHARAKGIEEKKLDSQLLNYFLDEVAISQELSDWCIRHLDKLKDEEIGKLNTTSQSQEQAERQIKKKLSNLLDRQLTAGDSASLEDIERWNTKEASLKKELADLNKNKNSEGFSGAKLEKLKKRFSLMTEILDTLQNGSREARRAILLDFGSNLTLNNGIVSIYNVKEVELFLNCIKEAKSKIPEFEPKKTLADKRKTESFDSALPILLRG